jgi:hypothetical protein
MKLITNSPSQAAQDSFVMNMLDWKSEGYYLEIGAYDPVKLSNTYTLEQQYNWSGVSLDRTKIDFSSRKNPCITTDATTCDYSEILEEANAPKIIDYLQLDIDPAPNTLRALKIIPFDKYQFKVITFEHDAYRGHDLVRKESRDIFQKLGYKLLISNLGNPDPYEDWYIHPDLVDNKIWSKYEGINNIYWGDIFDV